MTAVTNESTSQGEYSDGSATPVHNAIRYASGKFLHLVAFLDLGGRPEQIDIAKRALYRSINGQKPTALPRRLGAGEKTHFDVRRLGEAATVPGPIGGENTPPPQARWAFPFRSRVYYRGRDGDYLFYSKKNFPEAVSPTNFIEVNTNDGDKISAWGVAQDYAMVFKRNSVFLLTHDKAEEPVITPLSATYGAISDRGVISFNNNTYFVSDVGFHMFDGSSFKRLSTALDERIQLLPRHTREGLCVFSDTTNSRVYIAVNSNPGDVNNEVWVIHTSTGAFSVISSLAAIGGVNAAINYKGEVVVASSSSLFEAGTVLDPTKDVVVPDLFMWDTGYDHNGTAFTGSYSSEWLELKNPHSDKRFYKLLLYFVQTGSEVNLQVDWYLNWDERTASGTSTVSLNDEDASEDWDDGDTWGTVAGWDEARLVSKFVDLSETSATGEAQDITAKSIRFKFSTTSSTKTPVVPSNRGVALASDTSADPATPFKLVGWQVVGNDYGERDEGSSNRD
jgi:hypothetical protein